jgi:hypothetical protein
MRFTCVPGGETQPYRDFSLSKSPWLESELLLNRSGRIRDFNYYYIEKVRAPLKFLLSEASACKG